MLNIIEFSNQLNRLIYENVALKEENEYLKNENEELNSFIRDMNTSTKENIKDIFRITMKNVEALSDR